MARYFNLAYGKNPLNDTKGFPWPYEISICFDEVSRPIAFSEGSGHLAAGSTFTASEALTSTWGSHFEITGGLWLVPYIERLAQGIPLPRDEMLKEFERRHGREPTWFDTKD